uniref:Retrovirus-related Pol polyprotein from transposon TNT 1-94 n=1 Tax=Tanacetum cinerariifolium TaxID=118510 RepID=A0A6L2K2F3_TANCI|nr:retrovirus-related Pol polyprotein from transposon TNT 1-94 [Tanacetum cinerariifolium]
MDKAKPLSTAIVGRSLNVNNDPFLPCTDDEEVLGPKVSYLRDIGSLMYLTNYTRDVFGNERFEAFWSEHIIVAGADNRPPMLEKSMYTSWASRMLLYIKRMTMQQVQVNTKFLNGLQPEWSKFVTDVKLAKSMYTTYYDQMYAYLRQYEGHANESYQVPHHQKQYQAPFSYLPSSVPQHGYQDPSFSQQPQAEFPQLDSKLVVPSFLPRDDLIASLNKAMAFLRHMARQCTQPKRPRNSTWFKEKLMLAEAHEFGQTDDLDAFDFDCDEAPGAKAVLMANLFSYDSDAISEVPNSEKYKNNVVSDMCVQEESHFDQLVFNLNPDIDLIAISSHMNNICKRRKDYIDAYSENLVVKVELAKKEQMVEKKFFDEVVLRFKHARELRPLDSDLDSACKYAKRIQEVLVYIIATCPSLPKPSEKLVAITQLNQNKKVRLLNLPHHQATLKNRSQPSSNTKNNRISQTTNSNMKNKVKDHSRNVKSNSNKTNRVSEPVSNANVKHTMLNANSELISVKCNKCMFDANHDLCVLDFVNDVNVRSKSKSHKSSKKKKTWKPTNKVFIDIGYRWKPTGRTFTIVRNTCPLTRITSTKVEPLKETTLKSVTTPNPKIKIYRRKTKAAKWAEAVNTTCYTQNRSLICLCYNKTPYELMHDKKPDLSYLHVFGSLCYLTNDSEDLGKLKAKADIGLELNHVPQPPYVPPIKNDWDLLFQPMFDDYFNPLSSFVSPVQAAATPRPVDPASSPSSTTINQVAPSTSNPSTQEREKSLIISQGVKESPKTLHFHDDPLHV